MKYLILCLLLVVSIYSQPAGDTVIRRSGLNSGGGSSTNFLGVLSVTNGGTGVATIIANNIPQGNGTSPITASPINISAGTNATLIGNLLANGAVFTNQVVFGSGGVTPADEVSIVGNGSNSGLRMIGYGLDSSVDVRHSYLRANGTLAAPTIVSNEDRIVRIKFGGYDGSTFQIGSEIRAIIDGTPGAGDMPTRLSFWTTLDGGITGFERLRISNNGLVNIGVAGSNNGGKLEVLSTTEQLRLSYDATHYSFQTVNSSGNLTIAPSGGTANVTGILAVSGNISAANLTSGTYAPTVTIVANLDAASAGTCQYMRVGNTVTVSGRITVDPTTTLTDTQVALSLPIASALTTADQVGGTAYAPAIATQGAAILGDATNDRAIVQWKAADITSQPMYFSFTYQIL